MSADSLIVAIPTSPHHSRSDAAALGFGEKVASQVGGKCDVLLVGPFARAAAPEFARLGARKVLVAEHADLAQPTGEAVTSAIVAAQSAGSYRLIAAASTTASRDSLPRVAARLGAPMASDVLEVRRATAAELAFTKPAFYSNLLAEIALTGPVVVATCRASSFEPPAASEPCLIEDLALPASLAHAGKKFIEVNRTPQERPELTEADTIVSGGRGTKGAEGFKVLEQFADMLGAAVGASRAAVDSGWMPNDMQVGQTGKVVAPKLYIACGISGAIQHLAGMRNSKTIVAINKDANAPIFEVADYGLVADLFEAVPQLMTAIKAAKK